MTSPPRRICWCGRAMTYDTRLLTYQCFTHGRAAGLVDLEAATVTYRLAVREAEQARMEAEQAEYTRQVAAHRYQQAQDRVEVARKALHDVAEAYEGAVPVLAVRALTE